MEEWKDGKKERRKEGKKEGRKETWCTAFHALNTTDWRWVTYAFLYANKYIVH
jgi:hypothetical protein